MRSFAWCLLAATPALACSPPAQPEHGKSHPPVETTSAAMATPATSEPTKPPSTSGPPKSLKELVDRAVAAVKANDPDGYVALLFTSELRATHCPKQQHKMSPKIIERLERMVRRGVAKCHDGSIDWSIAKQLRVDTGAEKELLEKCGGEAYDLDDITVLFQVGSKTVSLKLADPILLGDTYAFADKPRCRLAGS